MKRTDIESLQVTVEIASGSVWNAIEVGNRHHLPQVNGYPGDIERGSPAAIAYHLGQAHSHMRLALDNLEKAKETQTCDADDHGLGCACC